MHNSTPPLPLRPPCHSAPLPLHADSPSRRISFPPAISTYIFGFDPRGAFNLWQPRASKACSKQRTFFLVRLQSPVFGASKTNCLPLTFNFHFPFENSSAAIRILIAILPSLCNYCLSELFANRLSKVAMSSTDHLPAAAKATTYHSPGS